MSLSTFIYDDSAFTSNQYITGYYLYHLGSFVIPEYLDNPTVNVEKSELLVTPGSAGKVTVLPGAASVAFVGTTTRSGCLYVNDDDTDLSIDSAVNNRIDRVVIRASTNSARLTIIKGVEAASPAKPALTTTTDFPLAWIWVPAGFNSAADTINEEDIHDERVYRQIGPEAYDNVPQNLMYNSEFIAYSNPAAGTAAPEGWIVVGPPADIRSATITGEAKRGRMVAIQADANQGMRINIRFPAGVFTVRGYFTVTAGTAEVRVAGTIGVATQTITKHFYPISGATVQEFLIHRYHTGEELDIYIYGGSAASQFSVGPIMVTPGYNPGGFRKKQEIIYLTTALTDAAWTASAKSTAVTAISLATSFGNMLSTAMYCTGVILRVFANDSGSLGGNASVYICKDGAGTYPLSELRLDGIPNDAIREGVLYAPLGPGITFNIGTQATGAGTLDVTVEVIGIIT